MPPPGWAAALPEAPAEAVAPGEDADDEEDEEEDDEDEPLLHPATASAVSTATAVGASSLRSTAFGPVGRGPAGIGRVGSFLRFTGDASGFLGTRPHGAARTGRRDLCQHFTEMSDCPAPTRPRHRHETRTP
nr:hypothetical protein KPHV_37210 [Kitasatospora purpeofusca]